MSVKVYISGKITGDPDYREKFTAAARALTEKGYIVLDPAGNPAGMRPADYMRLCFAMMDTADVVFFLPDWKDSRGARLEMAWCAYTEKPIGYLCEGRIMEAVCYGKEK